VQAFESVSTWQQPLPPPASADRTAVIGQVAARIARLSPGRLRVGVDGRTAAGKTSFGHELATALRGLGRPTMRASMDDFKHPWRHAREIGYDRVTGEGSTATPTTSPPPGTCCSPRPGPAEPARWCCARTIR
jgi:uridine kinase